MSSNTLTIQINAPTQKVFSYSTDPRNTHLWCQGILEERRVGPLVVGALYTSTGDGKSWSSYEVVELEENKRFKIKSLESDYEVEYSYSESNINGTTLIYSEHSSALSSPLTLDSLLKLKRLIEEIK